MGKKRKVECPHCDKINEIDVDGEMGRQGEVYKMVTRPKIPEPQKFIIVACQYCGKPIKIKTAG